MITKYIVLNETNKILMVLRPYQYYAVEKIVDRVRNTDKMVLSGIQQVRENIDLLKASQILKEIPKVEKVVLWLTEKTWIIRPKKNSMPLKKEA